MFERPRFSVVERSRNSMVQRSRFVSGAKVKGFSGTVVRAFIVQWSSLEFVQNAVTLLCTKVEVFIWEQIRYLVCAKDQSVYVESSSHGFFRLWFVQRTRLEFVEMSHLLLYKGQGFNLCLLLVPRSSFIFVQRSRCAFCSDDKFCAKVKILGFCKIEDLWLCKRQCLNMCKGQFLNLCEVQHMSLLVI